MMKKASHPKALYHFTKKQKNKDSTSTKDLNDSLDQLENNNPLTKKYHYRTQSCPPVEPVHLQSQTEIKADHTVRPEKQSTTRSQGGKIKLGHRNCHSQAEIDSLSGNQCSVSIENLSAILYRKNSKESILKKSRAAPPRFKPYALEREHYEKVKLDQQIKKYELNQELAELERRTKGIALKQQILETLLGKFQGDLTGSQELILP